MWEMLITAGKDLKITFSDIRANDTTGTCHWEAWYTFSRTGKKVHNIIDASFEFQDGKIIQHEAIELGYVNCASSSQLDHHNFVRALQHIMMQIRQERVLGGIFRGDNKL